MGIDLLMVEQIIEILFVLPFTSHSPVVQPILAVVKLPQPLFVLPFGGLFIKL
jgi:hypothetical protein